MDPLGLNPTLHSTTSLPTSATVVVISRSIPTAHHNQNPITDNQNPPIRHMTIKAETMPQPPPAPSVASRGGSSRRKQSRPQKLNITPDSNSEAPLAVEPLNQANGFPVKAVVVPEKRVVLGGPSGSTPGRPPKSRLVADVNGDGASNTQAVVGVKRGRRQKRSQGNGQMGIAPKRMGCWHPDYVGLRVLGPAEPQWMVDYALVRAKLESMQSKMRNAIGVLKPYLMAKGHLSATLQELNRISTMDIMAVPLSAPVE